MSRKKYTKKTATKIRKNRRKNHFARRKIILLLLSVALLGTALYLRQNISYYYAMYFDRFTHKKLQNSESETLRIQKIINNPIAQRSRAALIFRLEQETPEDWDTLLAEIAENDNVTLAHRDDGGVQLFWTVPKED